MSMIGPPPPGPEGSAPTPPPAAPPVTIMEEEPKRKGGFWRWIRGNRRWAIALIPIALFLGMSIGGANAGSGDPVAAVDDVEQSDTSALEAELADAQALIEQYEAGEETRIELEEQLAVREAEIAAREAAADEADAAANANSFGDGTYLIGTDIQPGTYRTEAAGNCYWERLAGLGGNLEDIIANDLPSGAAIVEIASSDVAFSTQGCGTWQKVG